MRRTRLSGNRLGNQFRMLRHDTIPVQPAAHSSGRLGPNQPDLQRQPNIDAAVLRAGTAAIMGRGEKAVMAAGRSARMIVAILRGGIGTILVVVIIALHRGMIVVMLFGFLFVMVFRMVLRDDRQRYHGGERERCHAENQRFPTLMTHGRVLLGCGKGAIMKPLGGSAIPGVSNSLSAGTYAKSAGSLPAARRAAASRASRFASSRRRAAATISGRARSGRPASNGGAGAYSIPSCTTSANSPPTISPTTVSAMSIPAVTPPPVMMLPSRTTREGSATAPNPGSRSLHAQWQAARFPRNRPAAPSRSDPVQTDVIYRACSARRRIWPRNSASSIA